MTLEIHSQKSLYCLDRDLPGTMGKSHRGFRGTLEIDTQKLTQFAPTRQHGSRFRESYYKTRVAVEAHTMRAEQAATLTSAYPTEGFVFFWVWLKPAGLIPLKSCKEDLF